MVRTEVTSSCSRGTVARWAARRPCRAAGRGLGRRARVASAPPRAVRAGVRFSQLVSLHLGISLHLRTAAARVCPRQDGEKGSTPAPLRARARIRFQSVPFSIVKNGYSLEAELYTALGTAACAVPQTAWFRSTSCSLPDADRRAAVAAWALHPEVSRSRAAPPTEHHRSRVRNTCMWPISVHIFYKF